MGLLDGGRRRRRRQMMRRLRELDRLDARAAGGARPRRGSSPAEILRGVVATTAALAVLALVAWHYGLAGGLGPLSGGGGPPVDRSGPGTFRFIAHQPGDTDRPVTYDSCERVRVRLNPDGGPDDSEAIVRDAIRTVADATGLELVWDGRTDARPSGRGGSSRGRGTDPLRGLRGSHVLVAFATAAQVPALKGDVAGIGGSTRVTDGTGRSRYVGGEVTLDEDAFARIRPRADGRDEAEAIVLHELGHVVGLDHVEDRGELMNAENLGLDDFGPGDLTGLAALGRGPCRG